LAHDIGSRLGCGAHLAALRRTAIGTLRIEDAVSLPTLEACDQAMRRSYVRGADLLVLHLPAAELTAVDAKSILQGKIVDLTERHRASGTVRLYDESGAFLGVGFAAEGKIVPRRMCSIPLSPTRDGMRLEELPVPG